MPEEEIKKQLEEDFNYSESVNQKVETLLPNNEDSSEQENSFLVAENSDSDPVMNKIETDSEQIQISQEYFKNKLEQYLATPEGQKELEEAKKKETQLNSISESEKVKYIADEASKGITEKVPVGKASKAFAKGVGKTIIDWVKGTSNLEKTQDLGQIVAIAVERTVQSVFELSGDMAQWITNTDNDEDLIQVDFVPNEWETPGKKVMADLLTMFTVWRHFSKKYGLLKNIKNIKTSKDFAKVVAAESVLNGLLDAVLVKPDEEVEGNLANALNSVEGVHYFIWDSLETKEDDSNLEKRIKNFVLGMQFSVFADVIAQGLTIAIRSLKTIASKDATILRKTLEAEGITSADDIAEKLIAKSEKTIDIEKTPSPEIKEGQAAKKGAETKVAEGQAAKKGTETKVAETKEPNDLDMATGTKNQGKEKMVRETLEARKEVFEDNIRRDPPDPNDSFTDPARSAYREGELYPQDIKGRLKKYDNPELFKAQVDSIENRIKMDLPDVSVYVNLRKELISAVNSGVDLDKLNVSALLQALGSEIALSRYALKHNFAFDTQPTKELIANYLSNTKKAGDASITINNVNDLVNEYGRKFGEPIFNKKGNITGYKLNEMNIQQADLIAISVMQTKLIKQIIHNRNFNKLMLGEIKELKKKRKVFASVEDTKKVEQDIKDAQGAHKKILRESEKLLNDFVNFDNVYNPLTSETGKLLKILDLNVTTGVPNVNLNNIRKLFRDPFQSISQKLENIDRAMKLVDIKSLSSEAGIKDISVKMKKDKSRYLTAAGEWLARLTITNLISAPSTKLFITGANFQAMSLKVVNSMYEDLFNITQRTFRLGRQIPQAHGSYAARRMASMIAQLKPASLDLFAFLLYHKSANELYGGRILLAKRLNEIRAKYKKEGLFFDEGAMKKEIAREEAPWKGSAFKYGVWDQWRVSLPEVFKKLKTGIVGLDQLVAGTEKLFDITLKGMEIVHGTRYIQGIDYFTRILTLPIEIDDLIRQKWNKINRDNAKQLPFEKRPEAFREGLSFESIVSGEARPLRVYTKEELEQNIKADTAVVLANMKSGQPDSIVYAALDEVFKTNFISSQVGVVGKEGGKSLGRGVRLGQDIVRQIPVLGKIITAFTNVALNMRDWAIKHTPGVNALNPEIQALWKNEEYAKVFGKSMGGLTTGMMLATWMLKDKDKTISYPDTSVERGQWRMLLGISPYDPVVIDDGKGQMYMLDSWNPIGGLATYYLKFLHYGDRFTEHKDFTTFMTDFMYMHLEQITPIELLDRYQVFTDAISDKIEFGYISKVSLTRLLDAGIIKRVRQYKQGYREEDLIQDKNQVDKDFNRAEGINIKWKELVRRNLPFLEFDGTDKGVPGIDAFGNETTIRDNVVSNPLTPPEMIDYSESARTVLKGTKNYWNWINKKIPAKTEKLYIDLWSDLADSDGLTDDAEKNPLNFYPSHKISIKEMSLKRAFENLIKNKMPQFYIDLKRGNSLGIMDLVYRESFIMTDEDFLRVTKLSAGNKSVWMDNRLTTGEAEIRKHLQTFKGGQSKDMDLYLVEKGQKMMEFFYKYGYKKEDAIKKVFYSDNADIPSIKRKWEKEITTYKTNNSLPQKGEFPESLRIMLLQKVLKQKHLFKPFGKEKEKGIGFSIDTMITSSLDGEYLVYKLMLPYVSPRVRETYKKNMRGILNEIAKPYNEFARYIFMRDVIENNKKFHQNIGFKFMEELNKKRLGFGYTEQEGELEPTYFHGQE